jgi:periplasmic divalent cation tolerance protein
MLIVLTTTPNIEEAEAVAERIVAERIAACVQILPQMKSFYFWEGEVRNETEHLLLIKTLPEKYKDLETFILENHSYSVPEIVAIKSADVSEGYFAWLNDYLK